MGRLDNKVAIITGAGSGIGRAAALLFAAEGASVAVSDIDAAAADSVAEEARSAGARALAVQADVTSGDAAARVVEETVAEFGSLHVLYNNAGVDSSGDVVDADEQDWDRCFAVNAKGTFLCSKHAAPAIETSGGGAIINQGSIAALVGIRQFAAYCAAKGAVVALSRSMALDLAPRGIRVNCICPGTVHTPMMEPMLRARGDGDLAKGLKLTAEKYPAGRLGDPKDIARVALFLASDDSEWITGSVYTVDGGMTAQ